VDFKIITTLCYIINSQNQVLLVKKKRGFGVDKWNGPGGKVEPNESIEESLIREIKEETGLILQEKKELGFIEFVWPKSLQDWNTRCHIYFCRDFVGEPVESEECLPQWFYFDQIPYDQMWDDDKYWYPDVLRGNEIKKRFYFNEEKKVCSFEDINNN